MIRGTILIETRAFPRWRRLLLLLLRHAAAADAQGRVAALAAGALLIKLLVVSLAAGALLIRLLVVSLDSVAQRVQICRRIPQRLRGFNQMSNRDPEQATVAYRLHR